MNIPYSDKGVSSSVLTLPTPPLYLGGALLSRGAVTPGFPLVGRSFIPNLSSILVKMRITNMAAMIVGNSCTTGKNSAPAEIKAGTNLLQFTKPRPIFQKMRVMIAQKIQPKNVPAIGIRVTKSAMAARQRNNIPILILILYFVFPSLSSILLGIKILFCLFNRENLSRVGGNNLIFCI